MAWTNPNAPNLTDFTTFVLNQGVPTADLPSGDEYLTYAFNWAINLCLTVPSMPAQIYILAVYNLGTHRLIRIAPDQTGQTWFTDARQQYGLLVLKPGVVLASGDQGTSQTLVVPEWYQHLPLQAQDLLKTPWGREYIDYAQMAGTYVVGVS